MKIRVLMGVALALIIYSSMASAQAHQLIYSDTWRQGHLSFAMIYPATNIQNVRFTLENIAQREAGSASYVRTRGRGFSYIHPLWGSSRRAYLMLVGISAIVPAGYYQLRASIQLENGQQTELLSSVLSVGSGNYPHQTIHMGAQGQAVHNNRTPERAAQAQRFFAALNIFEPDAAYDFDAWSKPVQGNWRYTSRYGAIREFIFPNGQRSQDFHNGEDFAGLPIGDPILAVADGRVVLAENRIVTGYTVILMHAPGVFSLYYHMNGVDVSAGQVVTRGERIGGMGATGFATGPHLHLTAYIQGQEIDPQWLFARALIDKEWIHHALQQVRRRM